MGKALFTVAIIVSGLLFSTAEGHAYCAPPNETPSCPSGTIMCSVADQTCSDGKTGWGCYENACPAVPGYRPITPNQAGRGGYPKSADTTQSRRKGA